jgi:hypothetical protein
MRDALPQASFIGFTGTPIELADANTKGVMDIFAAAELQKPDISILSDEFLATQTALEQVELLGWEVAAWGLPGSPLPFKIFRAVVSQLREDTHAADQQSGSGKAFHHERLPRSP